MQVLSSDNMIYYYFLFAYETCKTQELYNLIFNSQVKHILKVTMSIFELEIAYRNMHPYALIFVKF